ncbi:MFS transporter [Nonomuraea sp. NPDC002799]
MLDRPAGSKWLVLAVIALTQLLVVLDSTVVGTALPSAQADLRFSDGDRQWVVTAYTLAFGSLLLIGGRIADLLGHKTALLGGMVGFAVASGVAGAAGGFGVLVCGRALQGVFAAVLAPAALAVLTSTFTDERERGKAFGIFGSVAGSGLGVGLLLGGVLTEQFGWRWCLYINLVLAPVAFAGLALLLPHRPRHRAARLDTPGALVVTAGLFCLVYGLSNTQDAGWGTPSSGGLLVVAVALLALFAAMQARAAHPLLPPGILLDRDRGAAFAALLVASAGMFGVMLFLTYYLQQSLHLGPLRGGLAFLPMVACLMVAAPVSAGALAPRMGIRAVVAIGMAVCALAMIWLTRLGLDSTYLNGVVGPLSLFGAGVGLVIAPVISVATCGVAPEDAGVASAVVNATQQVGGTIGVALLSLLAVRATGDSTGDSTGGLARASAALQAYVSVFWALAAMFAVGMVASALLFRRSETRLVASPTSADS